MLVCCILFFLQTNAQVNYTFKAFQTTYTPIIFGSKPPLNNPTPVGYYENDEGFSNDLPIGFSFKFNNVDYSKLNVNVNGFITFGNGFDSVVADKYSINKLSKGLEPNLNRPIIAPLWDDLSILDNNFLLYKLEGTAPNRVFTIEWAEVHWNFNDLQTSISFQLKLFETSNKIQFIYNPLNNAPKNPSASIGISTCLDCVNSFLSVNSLSTTAKVSSVKEFNFVDNLPVSGLTYEFAPSKIAMPTSLVLNSYTSQNVAFSWNGFSNNAYEYEINTTSFQPSTFSSTNTNTAIVESLIPSTDYYIHVRNLASNETSGWLTIPFNTAKQVMLPFIENFESSNQIPSSMTSVNPTMGNGWKIISLSNLPPYNKAVSVKGNKNFDSDAWLVMPSMNLLGGSSYRIKFKFKASDTINGSQRLEIRIGKSINTNMSGWQTIYRNLNIKQINFKDTSFIFAPPSDEAYFIAFRSTTQKNESLLVIDDIEIEKVKPLPVKLISFTGVRSNNVNKIYFNTSAEIRNKRFEIERSSDGKNFSSLFLIDSKAPNGNSNIPLSYSYEDKQPNTVDYYRLKCVDLENSEFYSQSIKIIGELAPKLVHHKIYPNPAINIATSVIYAPYNAEAIFRIVDCFGKVVYETKINVTKGDNIIKTDVSKFSKGVYYAKLDAIIGGESETKAFLKQ